MRLIYSQVASTSMKQELAILKAQDGCRG